ncbi:MAG: hypothetical protein JNK64_09185 [Myxococcales bacterium]|nr:hypothetical protein [Myxococcales bacterium]
MSRLSCVLVAIWAVAACGDKRRPTTTPPIPVDATDAGAGAGGIDGGVAVTPTAAEPARVAPHTAFVTAVALDRAGTAAVSIDALGAIRLWRALDGSAPPVALPQHGARALEVARDGAGFTVGSIDGSSAAHLYHLDATGAVLDVADVPAVPQAVGLVPTADGAWLVARADQSIALVDRQGAIVDEVSRDGTRVEALRPLGASDAIALVSRQDATGRVFAAVTLRVERGHVTWQREVPLAIAPSAPVELAVAPDGKHLAYFADPAAVKAAAAAAAAPKPAAGAGAAGPRERRADSVAFAPRPVQPSAPPAVAVVIDATTGADVTPRALAAQMFVGAQRLGFVSADAVAAYSQSSGDVASALAADADLVATSLGRNCPPALAGGHVVAGMGQNLVVADDAGATRYLGYQAITAQAAALSPDGATTAWATPGGEVQLQPTVGPEGDLIANVDDVVMALEFVDATHLIAMTSRGALVLIDATTAKELARVAAPGRNQTLVWDPRGRWLAGLRDSGGVWVMKVDTSQTPALSPPKVISDGSTALWFLDAATDSAPALVTLDGASTLRTYTAAQLATGVPLNKVGGVPKHAITSPPLQIDRAGRVYVFDGRDLIRFAGLTMDAPRALLRAESLFMPMALPGGVTLVADAMGTVRAVRDDGGLAWSVNVGGVPQRPALSDDGGRVLLLAQAGALVVDTATGQEIAATCGWRFGAWPTPPQASNLGALSLCE